MAVSVGRPCQRPRRPLRSLCHKARFESPTKAPSGK